jgi:predicted nucleic acid-binding protein
MIYLLDSDAVAALVTPNRESHDIFMTHAKNLQRKDRFCLSILTIYEIEYSIHSFTDDRKKEKAIKSLSALKKSLDIIRLNIDDAAIYGRLKAGYKKYTGINRKAIRKHNLDISLASLAIAHNATLISGDSIYLTLQKVDDGLRYENWLV